MPLNAKGRKVMARMRETYGNRAERVFYAMRNSGKLRGVDRESSGHRALGRRVRAMKKY